MRRLATAAFAAVRPVLLAALLLGGCSGSGGGADAGPAPASPAAPGGEAPTTSGAPTSTGARPTSAPPPPPPTTAATTTAATTTAATTPEAADTALRALGPSVDWLLPAASGVVAATPAAEHDGVVVTAGTDCAGGWALLGLEATSGATRWQVPLPGRWGADELAADAGIVVVRVPGASTLLVGIEVATGVERWRADLGEVPVTAADLRSDPVVVAQQAGIGATSRVRAFGRTDGAGRWDQPVVGERAVLGLVAAPEGVAVFALQPADPPSVVGVDASTGATRWERPGLGLPAGAASSGGSLVVTDAAGGLAGVALTTGTTRWARADLVDPFVPQGTPVASGGTVLVGDLTTGRLQGVRALDGETVWRAAEGDAPGGAGPGGFALVGAGTPDALVARVVDAGGEDTALAVPLPTSGGREPVPVLVGTDLTAYVGRACPG